MNREIVLQVEGSEYKVSYPNTGQQIDIELMKAQIGAGNYDVLRFSQNPLFQRQADVIDMIATFSILVPDLKKNLNVKSFFDLPEEHTAKLLKVYEDQFIPWFIKIRTTINNPKEVLEEKKSEEVK